jgi:glucose/arabinose dehydrogenase
LEKSLLVAGLAEGSLWSLDFAKGRVFLAKNLMKKKPVRLRKVTQGPDGTLYVLTDEPDGKIMKIGK